MPPDIDRAHSQSSSAMSQPPQMGSQSRPGTADPMRSRSNTAVSKGGRRPRSRGSTASIHSSTTQQTQDQHIGEGFSPFMTSQAGPGHHVFNTNPEEMIMRFGQQLAHPTSGGSLDPTLHETHGNVMPRAEDFQGHSLPNHGLPHTSLAPEMVPHGLQGMPVPQYPSMYDNSIPEHIPERVVDENENSEAGARKKRGSTSTVANDNELRKLLRQYEGYTLKQMAAEVQKHEGAGGKSEKVKQVFAMLCGSVRRDRVYCCYAERCGSEHVSVLNPASFGKLVRIIFPNVQTRRLGVRGESKYHYVDLTVIEDKQQTFSSNTQDQSNVNGPSGTDGKAIEPAIRPRSVSISQPPADTAVFPSPTTSFTPKFPVVASNTGCTCDSQFRSNFNSTITLENVASQTGRLIRQMLHFPSSNETSVDNESLKLPDIRGYLPANTDLKVADALATLYRTHCISVIDSFRFCKERNLFRHFSAFHGTLTVPVQKLLTHPNLAPWIKECDWLMYQKMIEFVAPLTTQVVPRPVLDAFGSISQRLTGHIAETFKSHPVHVTLARLAPAHIFCNLLKHVLDVNQSAIAAAAWLCHSDNRNQMWLDFATFVDPKEMISRANIPACAEKATEQILKHDVRALLTPLDNHNPPSVQSFFQQPDEDSKAHKYAVEPTVGDEYSFPDKWISFILNLPNIFPNHPAQCIVDTVDKLWDCILHRLTLAGAQSFSAWWITKVFFHEMMLWQVEKGGFMKHTPSSLQNTLATSASTGRGNQLVRQPSYSMPGKNESLNTSGNQTNDSRPETAGSNVSGNAGHSTEGNSNPSNAVNDKSVTLSESMGSLNATNNDDSAIDLDDDSMLMSVGKYGDMMASDTADADGDVVVI
ncbi:DNA damage and replication checkpoint protein Rfx1 [Rasamsonia emersonii CBS 393.64]|uniref:DNA damage and replication checkpoint protein Rfx1 n=1 Tax=Rasamsonia emersonii (strain ATCC 16479 / CBS 393.64 / IMI 116815) TaxID=1408163 RepID=A0A0F4YWC3_RASE3|nr:DNA damage and replication checkpoint protein Rfx1 [Rasamsonia emersonii CBS 393.64]KKA21928.1 DNA damage and replication checkpoint protein Rfx1 [Rasamsonia emersonii CBS 393.64]